MKSAASSFKILLKSIQLIFVGSFFLSFFAPSYSLAQTLIVELSDSHSNYENMVEFLNKFQVLVDNFKSQNPSGQVVLLVNGDYGGSSGLASATVDHGSGPSADHPKADEGRLGFEVLENLAKAGIKVVFNTGNHEGHDFAKRYKDNRVFKQEMIKLAAASPNVSLVSTNLEFTSSSGLDKVFHSHVDIRDAQTGVTRIFGLTLDYLPIKSAIVMDKDHLLTKITEYREALNTALEVAARDAGVNQVLVMIHDESAVVRKVAHELEGKFNGRVKFLSWFAAHDHVPILESSAHATPIVNAGAQFDFVSAVFDRNGLTAFRRTRIDTAEKTQPSTQSATSLGHKIQKIAAQANEAVEQLKSNLKANSKTYGSTSKFQHGKVEMKQGRRLPIGVALGNAFRDWAINSYSGEVGSRPFAGLYNTSSYRLDHGFKGEVEVNDFILYEMHPFMSEGKIIEVNGAELLEILSQTAKFQENLYAIQLSDNLRLVHEGSGIDKNLSPKPGEFQIPTGIEIFENQTWRTLGHSEQILLGVDEWTATNGYHLKYRKIKNLERTERLSSYLKQGIQSLLDPESKIQMVEIIRQYLPKYLLTMTSEIDNSNLFARSNANRTSTKSRTQNTPTAPIKCSKFFQR